MSEDESNYAPASKGKGGQVLGEDESIPKRRWFKIINMQWQSQEVMKWLRTMDLIYIRTKFYKDKTSMPGSQFRKHFPFNKVEIGWPIRRLPCNFYNVKWL
jgi:hypothetical protein